MAESIDYALFPTLVRHVKQFLTLEQCDDIKNYILTDPQNIQPHGLLVGDSYSSHSYAGAFLGDVAANVDSCRFVQDSIKDVLLFYTLTSGLRTCKITNSWFNTQGKGSLLKNHKHPDSVLSGALYINVDSDSSPLCFDSPNPFITYTSVPRLTTYSNSVSTLIPEIGDLVVFPSWLSHGSNGIANQTNNRIAISFNAV
jgi:hypothetical protein